MDRTSKNHRRILFGLFYRPPNPHADYLSSIEDSLGLAINTGITEIVVTGDFNINMTNPNSARKIDNLSIYVHSFPSIKQLTNLHTLQKILLH